MNLTDSERIHLIEAYAGLSTNALGKYIGIIAGLTAPVTKTYYVGNERREQVFEMWEVLTTHCARRTFVVSALFLGIPAEVVMKWTGHSDFDAMKPFRSIDRVVFE